MRFCLGLNLIEFFDFDQHLGSNLPPCIDIRPEFADGHSSDIVLRQNHDTEIATRIRIQYSSETKPQIAFMESNRLVIGLGNKAIVVDTLKCSVLSDMEVTMAVHALIPFSKHVLVLGEVDLLVLDNEGASVWNISLQDVVASFKLNDDRTIDIRYMNGSVERFDLSRFNL